jgi:hypothetical protein
MKAKNYKKKGSQFFETLEKDIKGIVERIDQESADLDELEKTLKDLFIKRCKESFKNGVEAGRYAARKSK